MSIKLKYKLITILILIVTILTISSMFVKDYENTNATDLQNHEEIVETEARPYTMAISKAGSIFYEENQYFKRYTISCLKEINDLKYNNDKDKFVLELTKNQVSNTDINTSATVNFKEIYSRDNGDSFIINFKKLFINENLIYVSSEDKKKIVVFISKIENPYKYKVVVDPGHGGNDQGTSFGKIFEKEITLKISKYMVDNLRYNGCKVILTRDKDKWVDLYSRPDLANSENADILVSIHINSNKAQVSNGVDTYYYDVAGLQKAERMKLAKYVQTEILKSDSWKNMGVMRGNLAVLRRSTMPSILVECGFLSNAADRDKLLKNETLMNFGNNISNGIIKYLKEVQP